MQDKKINRAARRAAEKAEKKPSKKQIFAEYGLDLKDGKYIYHPVLGWIPLLIVDGNDKIGSRKTSDDGIGVWHFSTLPSNMVFTAVFHGIEMTEKGTCPCTCKDKDGKIICYALKGNYQRYGYDSLVWRTWLIRNDLDFARRALIAQIKAFEIKFMRWHASGDFDSKAYIETVQAVVADCQDTTFWTYTKVKAAETAFDSFDNAHIVPSVIDHFGYNFGHADYILALYEYLKSQGKDVYICRCGIDKNQHCNKCTACSNKGTYVLFLEHSTDYNPLEDPLYPEFCKVVEAQGSRFLKK